MNPVSRRLQNATCAFVAGARPFLGRPLVIAALLAASALVTGCAPAGTRPDTGPAYAWQHLDSEAMLAMGPEEAQTYSLFEDLGTWTSRAGEGHDAFLVRVGSSLAAYTKKTGFEACGYVATKDGGWSVHLSTNRSHFNCIDINFDHNPAVVTTTETIHSHPNMGSFIVATAQDKALNPMNGALAPGNKVPVYSRDFSDQDFQRGPGYLVTHGKLMYQNTRADHHDVGRLDGDVENAIPDIAPMFATLQERIPQVLAAIRSNTPKADVAPVMMVPRTP
jgi:hypothetical protein